MKRNYIANSGAYTSPGTPEYGDYEDAGVPLKGWSSERVALPAAAAATNSSRRHISSAVLLPFNSGRALPSKWDDAERWITSPVPGGGGGGGGFKTTPFQIQRQPKSKSGPLGPPQLRNHSPNTAAVDGGSGGGSGSGRKNVMVGSPFSTGDLVPDGVSIYYGVDNDVYGYGLSDSVCDTSNTGSRDSKLRRSKEEDDEEVIAISRVVSRRDMATQMSPEGSTNSSRKGRLSFSTGFTTSVQNPPPPEIRIRDVQVDKSVYNDSDLSEKHRAKNTVKTLSDYREGSPWDVKHSRKNASKFQKEEAKITAWENFQKAKAEAAIHKLETKLEKEKSASMDKILNKLKNAQMKAQEKRSSIIDNNNHNNHRVNHSPKTSHKTMFCKYTKSGSLFRCFF